MPLTHTTSTKNETWIIPQSEIQTQSIQDFQTPDSLSSFADPVEPKQSRIDFYNLIHLVFGVVGAESTALSSR